MPIDVTVSAPIPRHPDDVMAYLVEPRNDPHWIGGIVEVHPPDGAIAVGSRVDRVAKFMGRPIYYTLEIARMEPTVLAMRSAKAPFRMDVTYGVQPAPDGSTVSLRVQGGPEGIAGLLGGWLNALVVRRNLRGDLVRLRTQLSET